MKTLMSALLITCLYGFFEPLAAQDMFEEADVDGDEILDFSEVTSVSPSVTKMIFNEVDQNADGTLDYDEYSMGYVRGFLQPRRPGKAMDPPISDGYYPPGS